jgi:hypothetical protein
LLVLIVGAAAAQPPPRRGPVPSAPGRLPLDALADDEKRAAERIALADRRVQELLGSGQRRLVSIDVFAEKPPREQLEAAAAGRPIPMARSAEVLFFRPEGEVGVRAIVDLSAGTVTDVSRVASPQVPLTQADLAEAWQLAAREPQVRSLLGADVDRFQVAATPARGVAARPRYAVEALPMEAVAERDPCYKHRCLQLLFRRADAYLMRPIVIVDLSARKVYVEGRTP